MSTRLLSPNQKSLLLFADSKNRDYPSGNSYVLHLTRPIKNIERVDLVSALVQTQQTTIDALTTRLASLEGTIGSPSLPI